MSKKNRKMMYDMLAKNDLENKIPGMSQDDGALVKEFGEPPKPVVKTTTKKGA